MHLFLKVLTFVSLLGICTNDDQTEYRKEQFRRNFGCENEGEYVKHDPAGPNCPCGFHAKDIERSKVRQIGMENRQQPYWKYSNATGKDELQHYICLKCSMCDSKSPVLAKCSTYADTDCGQECEHPYELTNAGCYILQNISANATGPSPMDPSPNHQTSDNDDEYRPLQESCDDKGYNYEMLALGVCIGICSILSMGVFYGLAKRCRQPKRIRTTPQPI